MEFECVETHVHEDDVSYVKQQMISDDEIVELSELFKVFGDSTRTKILNVLMIKQVCVCDIASILNMTKSAVSHQLRILRQAKLVKGKKVGKEVFYSFDDSHIESIYKFALEHIREAK